ncbi:unnamed protein product [Trichobilharzia szidati]|nr:unnamed protein product [Trichobilharzia szidati]
MDKTEIITKTDDTTVVKRKKSSKFGRFLSHLKRKSHHTSTATTTSLSSIQQPSTASVSSINTHRAHGCSTFSNWFNKNKENVHDKRSTVKHKKYKEVQGTVMFDQTTHSDVYDRILKNSILGTKLVKKAVICNRNSGAINAYGPEDFTPSVEQINKFLMLSQAERADRVILDKHFEIGMDKCLYKDVEDDTGVLVADVIQYYTIPNANEQHSSTVDKYELAGLLTKNSILIGIYTAEHRKKESKQLLLEMRDYLHAQGM